MESAPERLSAWSCRFRPEQTNQLSMHAEIPVISIESESISDQESMNGLSPKLPAGAAQKNAGDSAAHSPLVLSNNRILVVDDNPAIHDDFRKVLGAAREP